MSKHNDTGRTGEEAAREHLEKEGYVILETNWRRGRHEVDIIAYYEGVVVFVEVKTRGNKEHGSPEEFVDYKRQRAYIRMADTYMRERKSDIEEARFDIIAVTKSGDSYEVDHLKNAYSAIDA